MSTSIMHSEALQTPQVIATQLKANRELCERIGEQLRQRAPAFVYLIGRGSSDHAGVFAKYLIEVELGIPVCAAAPSVASVYGQTLRLQDAVVICISQSGRSPDLLAQVAAAKQAGAWTLGLVNDASSPLAALVEEFIPLHAGEEKAVAATKSYLATLSALVHLTAAWSGKTGLTDALTALPAVMLEQVAHLPRLPQTPLSSWRHCVVLGRGFGYAIAREIALKLKEVCGIHAEAFSSAEFLHGPVTLAAQHVPVISVTIGDESMASHCQQIDDIAQRGAPVIPLVAHEEGIHPRLLPLLLLLGFYLDVAPIAQAMGRNPDAPVGLKKVTQTL